MLVETYFIRDSVRFLRSAGWADMRRATTMTCVMGFLFTLAFAGGFSFVLWDHLGRTTAQLAMLTTLAVCIAAGLTGFVYYGRARILPARGLEDLWLVIDPGEGSLWSPGMDWVAGACELQEIILLSGVSRDKGAQQRHYFFRAAVLKTTSERLLPVAVWYSRRQKNSEVLLDFLSAFELPLTRVELSKEDRPWSDSFLTWHGLWSDKRRIPKFREVQGGPAGR